MTNTPLLFMIQFLQLCILNSVYPIYSINDFKLMNLRNDSINTVFKLMNHMDFQSTTDFNPLFFVGTLDGNGFNIQNLKITKPWVKNMTAETHDSVEYSANNLHFGIFSHTKDAKFTNLILSNITIEYTNEELNFYEKVAAGCLIADANSSIFVNILIKSCKIHIGANYNRRYFGLVAGVGANPAFTGITVSNCSIINKHYGNGDPVGFAVGSVVGFTQSVLLEAIIAQYYYGSDNEFHVNLIGGFVGRITMNSSIINSRVSIEVDVNDQKRTFIGGVVGDQFNKIFTVQNVNSTIIGEFANTNIRITAGRNYVDSSVINVNVIVGTNNTDLQATYNITSIPVTNTPQTQDVTNVTLNAGFTTQTQSSNGVQTNSPSPFVNTTITPGVVIGLGENSTFTTGSKCSSIIPCVTGTCVAINELISTCNCENNQIVVAGQCELVSGCIQDATVCSNIEQLCSIAKQICEAKLNVITGEKIDINDNLINIPVLIGAGIGGLLFLALLILLILFLVKKKKKEEELKQKSLSTRKTMKSTTKSMESKAPSSERHVTDSEKSEKSDNISMSHSKKSILDKLHPMNYTDEPKIKSIQIEEGLMPKKKPSVKKVLKVVKKTGIKKKETKKTLKLNEAIEPKPEQFPAKTIQDLLATPKKLKTKQTVQKRALKPLRLTTTVE